MKPLVYYCRWQSAALRLRGRDETAVWGQFVYTDDNQNETTKTFKFYLKSRELILKDGEEETKLQLDDMGVAVSP